MAKEYFEKEVFYEENGVQRKKTIGYYFDENGNEVEKYSIDGFVVEPTPEPEEDVSWATMAAAISEGVNSV